MYVKSMLYGLRLESNTWFFEREIYSEEFITQFRRNAVTCVFILKQLDGKFFLKTIVSQVSSLGLLRNPEVGPPHQ